MGKSRYQKTGRKKRSGSARRSPLPGAPESAVPGEAGEALAGSASSPDRSPAPPPPTPAEPLVSIVTVTYNSAGDLPAFLESLQRATDDPYELIVVDNASSDGTADLLRRVPGARLVLNSSNQGYARAANQGAALARGRYLVWLNPDTVVTTSWCSRMRSHFGPGVGAVGPVSNYVGGLQKYQWYARRPLAAEMTPEELARVLAEDNRGRSQETKLLIGFCLMVSREALVRAGRLDEDLFLGNDDLEYSWRLRREGFRLLVAADTLIYHRGQASFQSEPAAQTSRLVQESADCLQRKLELAFGPGRVPPPERLWGVSWFRPTGASHLMLSVPTEARAQRMLDAGSTLPPLALLLVEEPGVLFALGPGRDSAVQGLPASSIIAGDGFPPGTARELARHGRGAWDVALVTGVPPGLTEEGARALLEALEERAARQVLFFLPAHENARAVFVSRLAGDLIGCEESAPVPAAWQPEALLSRGYDVVELADYYGFEASVFFASRIRVEEDREKVREVLRRYYHPALVRFAAEPVAVPS